MRCYALDLMHRKPLTIDAWEGFRTSVQKRKTGAVLAFERKDSHSRQHPPSHCYGVAGARFYDEIRRDNRKVLWQCAAVKLPNAEKAIVEREKVGDYLLNAAHPDNGGKAAFFEELGFRHAEPETLVTALQELVRQAEVTQTATSPHGQKYVIVGQIKSPVGKSANVQTIWIVDKGWDVARLVTAYPHKA